MFPPLFGFPAAPSLAVDAVLYVQEDWGLPSSAVRTGAVCTVETTSARGLKSRFVVERDGLCGQSEDGGVTDPKESFWLGAQAVTDQYKEMGARISQKTPSCDIDA